MPDIKPIKIQPTMTAERVSDTAIRVTKQVPVPEPIVQTYDRKFLENQLRMIQAQLQEYTNARQAEIDEVSALLILCDEQGVTTEVSDGSQQDDGLGIGKSSGSAVPADASGSEQPVNP